MSDFPDYPGFPQDGLEFLSDLARNNNREWFQAHKEVYQERVLAPTQAFVEALGARLKTISHGIEYDSRANGGSIMRIYRDLRFSKDKTPYNPSMRVLFWEGTGKKTDNPGFWVGIEPGGVGVFCGQHGFPKPVLEAYREAVIDDALGEALERAIAQVEAAGDYRVGGAHYQRVPRGYDADHPRANLLKHNGLHAHSGGIPAEVITTPAFVEACFAECRNMAPLQQWLVAVNRRLPG